jgi:two-component system LytT family sensor kinase
MRNNNKRFIYMVLVGIVISILLHSLLPIDSKEHNRWNDVFLSVIITMLLWEGNLRLDSWLNLKFPWQNNPGRRLVFQLGLGLLFSVLGIQLPMMVYTRYFCVVEEAKKAELMNVSVVIGLLITIIILAVEISTQFFRQWKGSLVEVEKYKAETAQAQLQNLKDQINPHFLFNNLSVLSSLVYKDPDKAVDFINQLSKVYRYLLDNRSNELVTLEEEFHFIHSYIYLIQIRFDKNIFFELDIPEEKLGLRIPPMSLQLLIENAIKHNEISSAQPLVISVRATDDMLEVRNNLQLRSNKEPGSNTGLQNIQHRYSYFTDVPVVIEQSANLFTVRIPLLKSR